MEHDICHAVYEIEILVNRDNFGVGGNLNCYGKNIFIPECQS